MLEKSESSKRISTFVWQPLIKKQSLFWGFFVNHNRVFRLLVVFFQTIMYILTKFRVQTRLKSVGISLSLFIACIHYFLLFGISKGKVRFLPIRNLLWRICYRCWVCVCIIDSIHEKGPYGIFIKTVITSYLWRWDVQYQRRCF